MLDYKPVCKYMLIVRQYICDASKWRLGTTAAVPSLPPLARDAVIPARHSLGVLSSTRVLLCNSRPVRVCC